MTADTVWLFETPQFAWRDTTAGIEWDSENQCIVNANGDEITLSGAVAAGAMFQYRATSTVFASEDDAREWGRCKSYKYPDGWSVREVPCQWGDATPHPGRTHEALRSECTRDPIFLGQVRRDIPRGVEDDRTWWHTEGVFLTRKDGPGWLADLAPRTGRIYCVAAEWSLCDRLAAMTVGGRYS